MAYSSMRYQYETSPRKLKPEEKTNKKVNTKKKVSTSKQKNTKACLLYTSDAADE